MSAHPSRGSYPHRVLHRRPQRRRSQAFRSALPSRASWPMGSSTRGSHASHRFVPPRLVLPAARCL
eukprot:3719215-Pyramimonas_sp.AAC.1